MKIAVIQMQATTDKKKNVAKALQLVQKAITQKAEFILLPEAFCFRGKMKSQGNLSSIAENIPGESTKPFMRLAKKHHVSILAGTIFEKVRGSKKVFNTSPLIGPDGKIRAKYRKQNLFTANLGAKKIRESDQLLAGKKSAVGQIKNFKVGLSICYDLRFPQIYKDYSKNGATILCVPAAFTRKTGQAHWEVLLRARAIENLCYVLAPNQVGKDSKGIVAYGHSQIIAPWGKILACGSSNREEILFAQIDQKEIQKARSQLPGIC